MLGHPSQCLETRAQSCIQSFLLPSSTPSALYLDSSHRQQQHRRLTIRPTPTTPSVPHPLDDPSATQSLTTPGAHSPDSTFTVLGPTSSLLQIHLSASQPLHTRRGTLLALSGAATHVSSSLSPLSPLKRIGLGIPFIYQRIASTSPLTLLLSTNAARSAFVVLSLDGRVDWRILRRSALVAWSGSGQSLAIKPSFDPSIPGLANWSSQLITGRGLVALTAAGGAYETKLSGGEDFLAHPGNVVAYSVGLNPPGAYRLKSNTMRLQVPSLGRYLPETRVLRAVRESETWRLLGRVLSRLRLWVRTVVWGERVYLRFRGPGTLVMQGKGGIGALREVYERSEVEEWADSPAGSVEKSLTTAQRRERADEESVGETVGTTKGAGENVSYASVGKDGKIAWAKE